MDTTFINTTPRADASVVRRYLEALDAPEPATRTIDFEALEAAFVQVVAPYSRRNGI